MSEIGIGERDGARRRARAAERRRANETGRRGRHELDPRGASETGDLEPLDSSSSGNW